MKNTFKANAKFYNAVDWVRTHGWDLWQQFDNETWENAVAYVEMIQQLGYTKTEALAVLRK